jgi:hypothetical protein
MLARNKDVTHLLQDILQETKFTASRLSKTNQSGPSFHVHKISRWSANDWALDMIGETLVEMQETLETSSIARHSKSPLETSLDNIRESSVTFNEKTLRWHDEQTNLMVKGSDPRVQAAKLKPAPSALEGSAEMVTEKKMGLGVLAGFLEEIAVSNSWIAKTLAGGKKESAEDEKEGKTKEKNDAKNEKKQTSILGGMWDALKESGKKSWLADNWGKLLLGIGFLFAPLKWIKGIWDFVTGPFWEFFKEHPIITILGGIALWFTGGAFLSAIGTAIGTGIMSLFGGGGAAAGGIGLIGKLFLGVKAAALGGLASPLAIVGALAMAIFDGFTGLAMSGDWKVSKISGFLGGFFAGNKGWMGMFANMGKWAVAGAALGFPFGGIGAIPGGLVGAALGAIFNLIGGKRVAQAFDNLGGIFMKLWTPIWDALKMLWTDFRTYLIDPIANWLGNVWTSMTDDWSKNWGKFKNDLKETWDSIISPFKMLWDFLMDPANVITGEGIMEAVGAVGAKLKEWVSSLIGMVPFGDYILPDSLLEWAGLKAAETPTDDTDTTQPATETVAKTKDEKARVKSNLATLDELQEEGGVLGMRDKGVDSKTQEAIEGIGTDDLRMAIFGAKHVGLDKKDPALVKAMAEELEKRTMAKDDTEATIMTKGEWTASDEYKKTFKGEGASSAVQEMEYVNYVEKMRGTAGKDLSSDAESLSTTPTLVDTAKKVKVKKWITRLEKKFKGATGRSKWTKKPILDKVRKQLRGPDREAILASLKGTELEKAVIKSAGGLKGPADLTGPAFKGMRTSTGGLDMTSDAFTERMSSTQSPDDKMNTFNSIQEKNRTLQEEKSGSPIIITTNASSSTTNAGDFVGIIPKVVGAPRLTTNLPSQ